MLSPGSNVRRGNAAQSSAMPPLPQCLPLEPIMLGNQKCTRSGELRRVLGFPLGSTSEDHSFGVSNPKPPPSVATEELKNFKESVQDASRKSRFSTFPILLFCFDRIFTIEIHVYNGFSVSNVLLLMAILNHNAYL